MFGLNKYVVIAFVVLVILLIGMTKYALTMKEKATRMENNWISTSDTLKIAKDDNGIKTYRLQAQDLTMSELKETNNALVQKLFKETEASGIAKRKIEALQNVISTVNITLSGNKRDTLIRVDSVMVPMKYLEMRDVWYDLSIYEDSLSFNRINIKVYDDILITKFWDRKGFWLWRWLCKKEYYYEVKNLNPYSSVTSFKVIEIHK